MPARSPHPCNHPGCTVLVYEGSLCPAHVHQVQAKRDQAIQSLYNTVRWKKMRVVQLTEHPWCENGLRMGVFIPATDVHHVERHGGDSEKFYNGKLESLCHKCHSAWTAYETGWTDSPPSKMFCLGVE